MFGFSYTLQCNNGNGWEDVYKEKNIINVERLYNTICSNFDGIKVKAKYRIICDVNKSDFLNK